MKRSEFTRKSPGQLLPVQIDNVKTLSFLPDPLPPTIALNRSVLIAAEEARGAVAEFVGEARLAKDLTLVTNPLRWMEAVATNRLEGTHTEVSDVLAQRVAGPPKDPVRATNNLEVVRALEALETGASWLSEGRPLGLQMIREMQSQVLAGARGGLTKIGRFREVPAYIGNRRLGPAGARYVPPPYEHVGAAMDNLVAALRGQPAYSPLVDCAIAHYQFEAIHPFEDGNGRVGRLLIPLYLLSRNVLDRPNLYLSSYLAEHEDDYFALLKRVTTHGAWVEWILFFLEALKQTADKSRSRVRRLLELADSYRQLVRTNSRSQVALVAIDLLVKQPIVTAPSLAEYASSSYPAARTALNLLSSLGILSPSQSRQYKQQLWAAQQLLDEVYAV